MKLTLPILFLLSSVSGCANGDGATQQGHRIEEVSGGTVALGIRASDYRATTLTSTGSISGTVTLGSVSTDTAAAVVRDTQTCADSAPGTPPAPVVPGMVLVWVDGIAAGKPLPENRRETLTIEHCRFLPRLLAVVSGTTLNLFSRDRATYTSRFYREGSREPVDEIHTVDAGQVVPSEKIASRPGIVEARRREQPWERGYVAVFGHPYHAVTDAKGAFTIDSLPPGTYTVKVWHEGLPQPVEHRVVVPSGGTARLDLSLELR